MQEMQRGSVEPDDKPGSAVPVPSNANRSPAAPKMDYPQELRQGQQQAEQEAEEYLFELAPLGPEDLLARCREGPGNWWGDAEECLRVDERGRVVLVDPEMYYEVRWRSQGHWQ